MKIKFTSHFSVVNAVVALSLFTITSSDAISASKNDINRQLAKNVRLSPSMYSYTGRCEMTNITGFKNQNFSCKIKPESGRGLWIFVQPPGADDNSYHEESYLSFNGYSEECGFGVGCPFRLEDQNLSKALKKASSPNRSPTDFYIRKWGNIELRLVFDMGTSESIFTFKAEEY